MRQLVFAFIIGVTMIACKKEAANVDTTTDSSTSDSITVADDSAPTQSLHNVMKSMMDKMHQIEKTGNADYDLAASMKIHHQGAIDMAAAEMRSGTDEKLKEMAQKMSEMQQKEIAQLEEIMFQSKSGGKNYEEDDQGLGKAMIDDMMSMMKMPEESGSTDRNFANMMVKHHKDGIMMGQTILKYAKNSRFKSMTEKMISDQNKDIKELESWLAAN